MDTEAGSQTFPSTHWSAVLAAAGHDGPEARTRAVANLVEAYAPALLAFLQSKKALKRDRAEDVLQDFLADKILAQGLISRAERGRGKFRNFLMKSLEHFLYNRLRRDRAGFRCPAGSALREIEAAGEVPDASQPPHRSFDVAWAKNVLGLALEAMQRECAASARPDIWGIFDARVLGPTLRATEPEPYGHLVERFHFASPAQASNVLMTANRMFARCLRAVVGNYAISQEELEEELRDLRQILSSPCAAQRYLSVRRLQ